MRPRYEAQFGYGGAALVVDTGQPDRDGFGGHVVVSVHASYAGAVSEAEKLNRERKQGMDIGQALGEMRRGERVTRAGWNGKNMWLSLQHPDVNSKMTLPYVYMKTVDGSFVPWLCSQTDLLADDWQLAAD